MSVALWPVDQLAIINGALSMTGNYQSVTYNDGSDEWVAALNGWNAEFPALCEDHDWGFLSRIAVLQRRGTSSDPRYADAYAKPPDCFHVIWIRLAMSIGNDTPVQYQIMNNEIILNATGQIPPVPDTTARGVVTIKYISNANGPETYTPLFIKALQYRIASHLFLGFNEDFAMAEKMYALSEQIIQQARTRADQEMPKRAPFNSHLAMARRVRHPWPSMPPGWTDTGKPV